MQVLYQIIVIRKSMDTSNLWQKLGMLGYQSIDNNKSYMKTNNFSRC